MDFHHLQAIVTVADELNFTRAAQRLFVSQPALSQLVRRIEAEIGTEIFDRNVQPLGLTREGKVFVPRARRLLDDYAATLVELRSAGELGQVTVGTTPMLSKILIPDLIEKVQQLKLPFSLRPIESSSQELLDLVDRGVVDFAVISQRGAKPVMNYEAVAWSGFRAAIPADTNLLVGSQPFAVRDVLQHPLLLPKTGGIRTALDTFFDTLGIKPNIAYESGSTDTMLGLVEAGVGVALLPEIFITEELRVRHSRAFFAHMDVEPPPVAVGIASRATDARPPSVTKAMDVAKISLRHLFAAAHQS